MAPTTVLVIYFICSNHSPYNFCIPYDKTELITDLISCMEASFTSPYLIVFLLMNRLQEI